MSIRRVFFWAHLVAGVAAGLVIVFLSVTGALLTYERQIIAWAEKGSLALPAEAGAPLSADALATVAEQIGKGAATSLVLRDDPAAPVTVRTGRSNTTLVDPYSGVVLEDGAAGVRAFFDYVTRLHRWFAMEGVARETAAAITGAANLVFLFILGSGIVLWWPKKWKWRLVRMNLVFRRGLPNAKARDYNWHHVFGIWALIPLIVVVATAVVFSYPWANRAVYAAFGEEVPARSGPPGAAPLANQSQGNARMDGDPAGQQLQAIVDDAKLRLPEWRSITLSLPDAAAPVELRVDSGTGGQPTRQTTLTYAADNAQLVSERGFVDESPATRARMLIRFLHTGEALGIIGQTIAGLASLASVILAYTGLALAWRRLVTPLLRKRRVELDRRQG
ncbi:MULTISPECIES: PepSY-associated TM helix domain-containing protein [Actibacterium]|uniref:Putative iron-regulated membrane protein n=1 Tax=Actibacterium naphthalenivorans TaxID=1614693 RepID=A0A840CEH4_9RHOB|nr:MULTISPECIES: PepSY-associated TM helix domain-containing protein [Actibacterium]MBB4022492.1 putative iron-regulated membrane protein [Actibacterium naphthalenivorans]